MGVGVQSIERGGGGGSAEYRERGVGVQSIERGAWGWGWECRV